MANKLHEIARKRQFEIAQIEERNQNLTSVPYYSQIRKLLQKRLKLKKLQKIAKKGLNSCPILNDLDFELEPKIVNKLQVMRDFVDIHGFFDGYRLRYVENTIKHDPFSVSATKMFNNTPVPHAFINVEW